MSTLLKLKMSNWTAYGLVDLKDTTQNRKHTSSYGIGLLGTLKQKTVMIYVYTFLGDQPL